MVRDQNWRLLMFSHLLLFLSFSTDKIKSIAMNLLQGKEKKGLESPFQLVVLTLEHWKTRERSQKRRI